VVVECEKSWERLPSRPGGLAGLVARTWIVDRKKGERTVFGQDLFLNLPIRACPMCQRQVLLSFTTRALLPLAVSCGILGVFVLALSPWGLLALAVAVVLAWSHWWARARRRARVERMLRGVAIYAKLLDRYPEAGLTWQCQLDQ
jgi:hypothetical protein